MSDEWDEYKTKNADIIFRAINDPSYLRYKDELRAKEKRHGKKAAEILEQSDRQQQERKAAICLEILRQLPTLRTTKRGIALEEHCRKIIGPDHVYSQDFLNMEAQWELEEKAKGKK